ncbi:GNAT family N-acetyltransferase [Actinosynnema sp. NPDC020468]|uniref:GNAT family N-acetyltransferase n=1 Tax=Actinosynnema sp. NPDC020468 TaxID=3154488 RepID=UPI0033D43688
MLPRIQSALRRSIEPDAVRVGPFLARFDPDHDSVFLNYAMPDAGASPTPEEVAALVAAFRERSRVPRLEYLRPLPAVDAALAAAGFEVEQLLPMLALEELRTPAAPDGVEFFDPVSDAELRELSTVQHGAFGSAEVATDGDVARQHELLAAGGGLFAARVDGVVVGGGAFTPPAEGLSQVAGIAVRAAFRGRGIASTLCAELTARVLALGHTPFLETEPDAKVTRLYEPLGYRVIGESAAISLR